MGGIWKLIGEIEAPEVALPPISGGAPDDAESDPECWPAWTDDWFWEPAQHEGPLPLSVLAETAPAWEPSSEDWSEMIA